MRSRSVKVRGKDEVNKAQGTVPSASRAGAGAAVAAAAATTPRRANTRNSS